MKERLCTPDIELMTVSVRPFYLPREFTNVFITIVYFPPDAKKDIVLMTVRDHISLLSDDKPDALHLVFGDMNNCGQDLASALYGFQQSVDCHTRKNATLDLFFCNVKNSYKCYQMPPLKSSDHFMLRMLPVYKSKLKQTKPTVFHKQCLNDETLDSLNACFDLTDWDLFVEDSQGDVNKLVDLVTSYISFCKDIHAVKKQIKLYPNNKPWITPQLRKAIIEKHKSHGSVVYTSKQLAVNSEINIAKANYTRKIEDLFNSNNPSDAWKGLKVLLGTETKRKDPAIVCTPGSAERLNKFYARFDNHDFSNEHRNLLTHLKSSLSGQELHSLPTEAVQKVLARVNVKKASGPDKISAKLIKSCKDSLLYVIHKMFELSLSSCVFPSIWKVGEIIPVAKKDLPQIDNDLRPVMLTSVLSKCLERVGLALLMPHVEGSLDPLQFAYINGRSTDDATCYLLHRLTKHLDDRYSNTVRATFIDYSSTFNTIQPHILMNKLNHLDVPLNLQLWILDYLLERPQYVKTLSEQSSIITLNTGAPQGCVLFLYYSSCTPMICSGIHLE